MRVSLEKSWLNAGIETTFNLFEYKNVITEFFRLIHFNKFKQILVHLHNVNQFLKLWQKWHYQLEQRSACGSNIDNRMHFVSCPTHKKYQDNHHERMLKIGPIDSIPQDLVFFYNHPAYVIKVSLLHFVYCLKHSGIPPNEELTKNYLNNLCPSL